MLEDEKKEVLEKEVKPEAAETPVEELGLPAEEAAAEAAAETPAEELGLPAEDPEIAELEARIEGALEEEGPSKEDIFLAEKEAKKKAREERKAAKKAKKAQKAVKAETEEPQEGKEPEAEEKAEEEEEKAKKPKKAKKAKKPVFFDTATTSLGLAGRCALILVHTVVIAYVIMLLFGALEVLINNNPDTFRLVYPYTTAALHGLAGMIAAGVYGLARIACVIVRYIKKYVKKK